MTFDHAPINTITPTTVAEVAELVGVIEQDRTSTWWSSTASTLISTWRTMTWTTIQASARHWESVRPVRLSQSTGSAHGSPNSSARVSGRDTEAGPDQIGRLIQPHPTLSESFGENMLAVTWRRLHLG